ncbi:MAG: hypothetical protein NZL93_04120, partial [Chthoniobacterales bacterium]|nr:hypothetical protein [Chthoniobacterales bacterium]
MGNLQKDKQIEIPPPPHSNPSHETNERTKSKDTKEITKLPQPKSSSNPSLPSTRNRSSSSTLDSIPKFFSDPSDTQTQKPIKTGIFRHLNRTNSLDSTDSKY